MEFQIGKTYKVDCVIFKDKFGKIKTLPIINYPHNDVENGQKEIHYHIDSRFIHKKHFYTYFNNIRINKESVIKIKKYERTYYRNEEIFATIKPIIQEIYLGYTIKIITCPLHKLQFDACSKKLIDLQKIKQSFTK